MRTAYSTGRLVAALALFASAAQSAPVDFRAPGGGRLDVKELANGRLAVYSDFWRLEFDVHNGGALDTIVFVHGSGKNLLVQPFRTYLDGWSDWNAPQTAVRSSLRDNIARIEFSGILGAPGRVEGPVRYQTTWTITPFSVRADHTIRLNADLPASNVGIGSTAVRGDLNEFGLRIGPADAPEGSKTISASYGKAERAGSVLVREHHAPLYLVLFRRNLEGLDFNTGSGLAAWESSLARRGGLGRYEARVNRDGSSVALIREPLAALAPVTIRKGDYTFSYYLGLPRIVEKSNRKYRHISFGNHPWPSGELIGRWAEAGVNIARLHNDYAPDENFWHDGAWPPYDEAGMSEMRRVIATCHRHGIQVVPYFSIHEFHPKAAGYLENEAKWKRTVDQAGTVIHNRTRGGEYGAQMCLESGWLERRKADVERAYRELGFDGIYYDWSATLPCNNKEHNPQWHAGTDGMIDLLAWTRRLIAPQGTLILHLSGWFASIAYENYGDLIVNMEENSQISGMPPMSAMALMTVLVEALPRSPCPSYRADRMVERNRNNIAQMAVLGLFPWSGQDGPVADETLKLFRSFKPYRLEDYRLRNADSGAVQTTWPDVYGAVYGSPQQALVVISNTAGERRKNIVWRVSPGDLGFPRSGQVEIKDTSRGQSSTLPWSALEDGSLDTGLDAYEYRIFEIRPRP